jgi:hypothetical protein
LPTLAYILAASHSGSTLLAMLLGAQPEAVTAGELAPGGIGDIDSYRCSCGAPFRGCAFWKRVEDEMRRRGADFALDRFGTRVQSVSSAYARRLLRPLHRGPVLEGLRTVGLALSPAWRRERPRILERNRLLVDVLAALNGRQVVVDSSKSALRLRFLRQIPGLDLRVIHLVRDGRGVALTYMDPEHYADARDPRRRGGGNGTSRDGERLSMAAAARQWRRRNEEAEWALRTIAPQQKMALRYEALCADPTGTLARVRNFLGLDPQRIQRDFRAVPQHVVGNGMRFDAGSAIVLDERWKDALASKDLRTFERIAGHMNRRYGYSGERLPAEPQLA